MHLAACVVTWSSFLGNPVSKFAFTFNSYRYTSEEPATYFDLIKGQMADSMAKTRRELDAMPESTREALEGYRPGAYLRLVLKGGPHEWVDNFDPARPLLVGGLLPSEDAMVGQLYKLKAVESS